MVKIRFLRMLLTVFVTYISSMEDAPYDKKEIKQLKQLIIEIDEKNRQEQDELTRYVTDAIAKLFVNNPSIITLVVEYALRPKDRVHLMTTDYAWKEYVHERNALFLDAVPQSFLEKRQTQIKVQAKSIDAINSTRVTSKRPKSRRKPKSRCRSTSNICSVL